MIITWKSDDFCLKGKAYFYGRIILENSHKTTIYYNNEGRSSKRPVAKEYRKRAKWNTEILHGFLCFFDCILFL